MTAKWIRPERTRRNASFTVAKDFACRGKAVKAVLKTSAAGTGVWRVNGARVGDAYHEPAVSYYEKRVYFREYDVAPLLSSSNRIEAEIGGGWFEQNLAWACENRNGRGVSYGTPAAWCELEIEYADGTRETIATDETWTSGEGRSVWNNVYGGEIIDDRATVSTPGKTVVAADVSGRLEKADFPPCRELARIKAQSVSCALGDKGDAWIYDFGVNVSGTVAFKLPPLVPGSRLKIRLAETLTEEGFLDTRSEGANATHNAPEYVYIAPDSPAAKEFVPEFSYTSFRYAEVSGYEPYPDNAKNWGAPPPDDLISAAMIATDVKRIRNVETDDPALAKFIEIADRTIRCNFHGIPEDCPGREKGGWLGDAQVVCPYALSVWDLESLYVKFMRDVADGTELFGKIPSQVPTHRAFAWGPAPALWRAAAVEIPYQLYVQRGNETVVRENWPLIEKCLDMFADDAGEDGLVRTGYGDWLPPAGNEFKMPVAHSSNLCWIECLDHAAFLAQKLGLESKRDCAAEAKRLRDRFKREFYDEKLGAFGYDGSDAAAYNLGIIDSLDGLLERLESRNYRMTTGIYGSPHLAKALLAIGRRDVLMKVFFNPEFPSYRTILEQGFTTVPEKLESSLRLPRDVKGQASLSHPMHAGWLRHLV